MRVFTVRVDVGGNVRELRDYLGSRTKELSRDDLAALISERHPTRNPNGSTVQRWEEGTEPDIGSIAIMADLAGVSFEAFALGVGYRATNAAGGSSIAEAKAAESSRPNVPIEVDYIATAEEIENARLEVEQEERAKAKPAKARRRQR